MEGEFNNNISFLDLNVSKNQSENTTKLNLSIFRNKTFTGLGMNFHSCTYFKFKINNIKTLIHRAFTLCPTWISFNSEVEFLSRYFTKNSYPPHIFYNVLRKFLDSKLLAQKPSVAKAQKLTMYFKLPFLNNPSCHFLEKQFYHIFSKCYPHIDFKIVFTNNFTIHGLLNHKEKLPSDLCSSLVYLFQCDACSATYVGQTKKSLRTRAYEHLGRSSRTGDLLARPPQSAIRQHLEVCGSGRSVDNFKVLNSFSNPVLLKIAESIEIYTRKPELNIEESSFQLYTI